MPKEEYIPGSRVKGRHVKKDGSVGSYVLDFRLQLPNGTAKRIREQGFKTQAAVKARKLQLEREAEAGGDPTLNAKMTFAQLAELFLLAKIERSPSTLRSYRAMLGYVLPVLGRKHLHTITGASIDHLKAGLLDGSLAKAEGGSATGRPLSVQTTVTYLTMLRCIFAWGHKRKYLSLAIDPTGESEMPKLAKHKAEQKAVMVIPTHDQVWQAVDIAEAYGGPVFGCLINFLAATGLRVGEALALHWQHCHLDNDNVLGQPFIQVIGGKTRAATRKVTLAPHDVADLLRLQDITGGLVFGELKLHRVYDLMGKLSEMMPIKWHPHLLRHYHASACLSAGVSWQALMARLGHTTITMTIGTYGHLRPEDDQEVLQRVAARRYDQRI